MKIAVVMPAHNESRTIGPVIAKVHEVLPEAQVIVVEDTSTDDTARVAKQAGAWVLQLPNNLGYGGAVQTGLRYAYRQGFDVAVQMDADGQHDPADLPGLLAPVLAGDADVVLGSRFLGRADYHVPQLRRLGMRLFAWIATTALRQRLTDPTTGFQAHSRRVLRYFAHFYYHSDYLNPDTSILLAFRGYRIREVPVVMKERVAGTSMFAGRFAPALYVVKMFLTILVVVLREKIFRAPEEEKV
jgi:glycosyltransferase involved in cell wall biosynthesis